MSKSASPTPAVRRAQLAIIGRRSEQQDDSRFLDDAIGGANATLMIMADGMGGATGGAMASRLAVEAAAASFTASRGDLPDRLEAALHAANKAIADAVEADPALQGMGTTMILALVSGRTVTWTSVGDSLLFGVRSGKLERINADHSLAAVLDQAAAEGKISAEEAASSPQRNMLRSALTGGPIALIDTGERTLAPSTRLIAASDGVLTLSFDRIASLIDGTADVRTGLSEVIAAVEADMPHDQDNLTMLAIEVRASSGQAKRMSPLLLGSFVLGIFALIGALIALILFWPQASRAPVVGQPAPVPKSVAPTAALDEPGQTSAVEGTPEEGGSIVKAFGNKRVTPAPAPVGSAKPAPKPSTPVAPSSARKPPNGGLDPDFAKRNGLDNKTN